MDKDAVANSTSAVTRWLLAGAGVVCVGLAALGAVLPVLPTTIFLIAAVACFTRSCPWLERKLLRNRLFAPYMRYIDGDEPLPRRARITAMVAMWCCVLISLAVLVFAREDPSPLVPALLLVLGAIATVAIALWRRKPTRPR